MSKAQIEAILKEAFEPVYLKVTDDSAKHAGHAGAREGGGGHYKVEIIARIFQGKKPLDCHRMIYKALDPVKSTIHALAIHAKPAVP